MRSFLLAFLWILLLGGAMYVYFFHTDLVQHYFENMSRASMSLAYASMLLLGIVRGFTLIPVTYLIVLGLLFFPPLPLFLVIIAGILISSATVYYFFDLLDLSHLFESKYHKEISRIRSALEKNELPIIIAWSAFPLLPTDLICYVCGTLKVDIKKLLLGVLIGEGLISGIYIFFGTRVFEYVGTLFF